MSMLETPAGDVVHDVADYVAQVRRALVGLTPEQVDDLTDDLEVALADALADAHDEGPGAAGLVARFGTPERYAAELRTAAGLSDGAGGRRRRPLADVADAARAAGRRAVQPLVEQPWWPSFWAFARTLAPLWWVLRAWVVFVLTFGVVFGASVRAPASWPLLGALVVVSVQWGRGRWRSHRVTRLLWQVASVVVLVLALPILATAGGSGGGEPQGSYAVSPSDGVYVDGEQAGNLFVYGPDGSPIEGAQVYDDRGRPVSVGQEGTYLGDSWYDEDSGAQLEPVPATSVDGRQRWNVFPLQGASPDDPSSPVVAMPWPFARAAAVLTPTGAGTAPTTGPTNAPTTGPTAPTTGPTTGPTGAAQPTPGDD
ncbi:hypothetical protein [Cellulomonas sp. HZM]|uniref:HAAS signaling domain-containing protein n=1 Tax=Cellulomonas sp. HZM TaxID=1454010 RepID=UPI000492F070|nr:hypothetical protein [Cellulomonas sp. HZM]